MSVLAAAGLLVLKLVTGVATGSLGLLSEALHSGTDLVAALLTFFAVGIAVRPADRHHAYGHGKAEHLAALAEASILALLSVGVGIAAVLRFADPPELEIAWWAFAVVLVVIVVDASRTTLSFRAARQYDSAALESNALHFGSDLAGSAAVLIGLLFANAGHPEADAVAALFVALLVIAAAVRLVRRNVDVLMDTVPDDVEDAARAAIDSVEGVELAPAAHAAGGRPAVRRRRDRRSRRSGGRTGSRGGGRRRERRAGGAADERRRRARRARRRARGERPRPRSRARGPGSA